MDVFNLINGALFNVAKGANGKVEKVISTWDEFLNFELLHIGGFKLMSGSLIIVILMIIGTWIAVKLLRRIITRKGSETTKAQEAKRHTLFIIIKYVIWLASIIIMFEVIGIQVTLFLFGATAFLVTIGLGLQNIFRDIFSGMVMLFEETVQVGDIIEVNGEVGQVVEISLRSTEILTRDQVTLIMPNSKFIEEQVTNWTHFCLLYTSDAADE